MRSRDEIMANRVTRIPLHEQKSHSAVPTRIGYIRGWVNDTGNNIAQHKLAGYTVVEEKDMKIGDNGSEANVALGTGARKNVGITRHSDNTIAVLMEIPEELYMKDQQAKWSITDRAENELKSPKRKGENFYGSGVTSTTSFEDV